MDALCQVILHDRRYHWVISYTWLEMIPFLYEQNINTFMVSLSLLCWITRELNLFCIHCCRSNLVSDRVFSDAVFISFIYQSILSIGQGKFGFALSDRHTPKTQVARHVDMRRDMFERDKQVFHQECNNLYYITCTWSAMKMVLVSYNLLRGNIYREKLSKMVAPRLCIGYMVDRHVCSKRCFRK